MAHQLCPRCRCCDIETRTDGGMFCIGDCDARGIHEPETAEEWRQIVSEKDDHIAAL